MLTKLTSLFNSFLNRTPMYLLVSYLLSLITLLSFVLAFLGLLDFTPVSLLISLTIILSICIILNFLVARFFKLPVQHQSSYITGLILFLILLPAESTESVLALILASTVATLSKYILVWRNTHIFNPAAIGIFFTTVFSMGSAFWWVGSFYMFPLVLIVAFIVLQKTKRHLLFFTGLITSFICMCLVSYFLKMNFLNLIYSTYVSGPVIFFLSIMLTEPHTIAKNNNQQIFYGLLIMGLPTLGAITNIFSLAPEASLLIGNVFSFVFSKRERLILRLKTINSLNNSTIEYIFENYDQTMRKLKFKSGEYMEWTLNHKNPDSRSIRRYFTISSSAENQNEIAFVTKFPDKDPSSFKLNLKNLEIGEKVYVTQLSGDFLLPKNPKTNLVFIAGGIGITPFISQLRTLADSSEQRNITLFYCVRTISDIAYMDLFKEIINNAKINLRVIFILSEEKAAGNNQEDILQNNFYFEKGYLSLAILNKYLQDLKNTQFYLSGPNAMVEGLKNTLKNSKILDKNIHTDYFPGF